MSTATLQTYFTAIYNAFISNIDPPLSQDIYRYGFGIGLSSIFFAETVWNYILTLYYLIVYYSTNI